MMDLRRFLIVVLICSSVNTIHAQFIVKGTVQDPEGNGLQGVEISVANTTYGVISDYDGQYFLELNSSGKYPIRFHALGMYDTTAVNYLLGSNNMIENDFFEIGYKREIVNGLYDRIKFEYANRQPLGDIDQGPIYEFFESIDTLEEFTLFPEPPPFEPHNVSLLELKLQYRFKQKYIIKKGEKLIVGTEYPEIAFSFRQGIPNLFGSDVRFNMLEFTVSDEINLGNFRDSNWNMIAGTFLNKKDLRIIEHRFLKNQTFHFFLSRCSLIKPSIRIIILMGPICKPFICITSMVIF